MIVKDEAHVIGRCLAALKPFIDHALIIDTGSTDETPQLIPTLLPDVTIEHSEFVSFRHNRTELLERARVVYPNAEFHLMMDADDLWVPEEGFAWPEMKEDAYEILHRLGSLSWWRPQVYRANKPFRYEGAAHEYLHCDVPFIRGKLEGVRVDCGSDGARRTKEPLKKYERVAGILEKEYEENPNNRRAAFYLAQSYRDSLQRKKALEMYERRAEMGGWAEEVWYSKYQIGVLREFIGFPVEDILNSYLDAYLYRPKRAESLVAAASVCRRTRKPALALLHAATAIHISNPKDDRLFVDWMTYAWRAWDEFSMACWNLNRMEDAIWGNYQMIRKPASEGYPVERILSNITHCCRPKDRFDDLRAVWERFMKLPQPKKTTESIKAMLEPDLKEFTDLIVHSIENGGGFPR
jgi:tetratricopeptide (TPR) repeat protein